ncbi:MAG: NBR1-Ig-like domain-containing protein [Anaerolineaceae bacterium]
MKIKKFERTLALGCLSLMLILSACAPSEPTISPEEVLTSVALTVESDFTRTAIARPTETPTVAPTATNTPIPVTPTLAVTNTPISATATISIPSGTDNGVWASSNPADGTKVNAGQEFKVTLTLMNTGTSTWTTAYSIKFSSGSRMGAPETIMMPYEVPPTKNVQFTISFTAPSTTGDVRGNWSIVNASGTAFYSFYVEYEVIQP